MTAPLRGAGLRRRVILLTEFSLGGLPEGGKSQSLRPPAPNRLLKNSLPDNPHSAADKLDEKALIVGYAAAVQMWKPRSDEMSDQKTVVVLGVGEVKGLGAAVAMRFARAGYTAVVAGRTQSQLDKVVGAIQKAGGEADAVVTDASSEDSIVTLVAAAEKTGPIEVAVYNAGGNSPQTSLATTGKHFETSWKVGAFGGFVFGRETIKAMLPRSQGTLLFTGASASLRGRPGFVSFAAAKAALRAVSQAFAREFGPKGIHVAHVVIDGAISGHRIHSLVPDFAKAKGEDGLLNLEAIAENYWQLHQQHKTTWSQEIDLRPFKESF